MTVNRFVCYYLHTNSILLFYLTYSEMYKILVIYNMIYTRIYKIRVGSTFKC